MPKTKVEEFIALAEQYVADWADYSEITAAADRLTSAERAQAAEKIWTDHLDVGLWDKVLRALAPKR